MSYGPMGMRLLSFLVSPHDSKKLRDRAASKCLVADTCAVGRRIARGRAEILQAPAGELIRNKPGFEFPLELLGFLHVSTIAEFLQSFWPNGPFGESPAIQRFLQENGIQLDPSAHQALGNIPANDAARVPRWLHCPAGGEIVIISGL